jgi:transcription elongation factor Elf1
MADISFVCPQCNQELEAPTELAGDIVECPSCETQLEVPGAEVSQPAEPPSEAPNPSSYPATPSVENACSNCKKTMEVGAVLCLKCGYHAKLGKTIDTSFE